MTLTLLLQQKTKAKSGVFAFTLQSTLAFDFNANIKNSWRKTKLALHPTSRSGGSNRMFSPFSIVTTTKRNVKVLAIYLRDTV